MLKNRQEELIQLAILGHTVAYIAQKLEYTPQHVNKLLRTPAIQERIKYERETRYNSIIRERLNNLAGLSIDSIEAILATPDEKGSTKLAAAQLVIEQIIGKAKGTVEVKTNLLADLITLVDQMPREVKPKDKFDLMLEEIIPSNHTIGTRR